MIMTVEAAAVAVLAAVVVRIKEIDRSGGGQKKLLLQYNK